MISRRRFLRASSVAGAALSLAPLAAAGPADAAELPPSLAALPSMKHLAQPITREERAERQERARRLMSANQMDAIVMSGGTSLQYFAGVSWWLSERLFAMVLPAKGEAFYVSPAFEEGRAREQLSSGPAGEHADVRVWQEDESPYQLIAQGLKDRGISTGTIGMEETLYFVYSDGIRKAAPHLQVVSATPVTAGCRRLKSQHELALMRLASQVTLTAYEASYKALKPGMTRDEFGHLLEVAHERLGFSGDALVEVGEYSAFPHGSIARQVIREGTIVLVDGGCTVEGYCSDITRTFLLGKPSDKMREVFAIVHRAQAAALQTAKPGVECQAVDAAARKVITDAGYGPDYKYFTHRLGHGMGLDGHEWPYLVRGNTTKLEPHMTFSDEPGIYLRGEFGVRLEDDMHITEDGAELFTPPSPSLENPFGKG